MTLAERIATLLASTPQANVSPSCRSGSAAENKPEVKAAGIPTSGHTVHILELKTPACQFCYQDRIYRTGSHLPGV